MRLDEHGLAWGWHNKLGKWVKRHPVDIPALVKCGELSHEPPESSGQPALPPGFTSDGPPSKDSLEELFGRASKPELQDTCQDQGVDWQGADTKATLIAKLIQNGVTVTSKSTPAPTATTAE